MGITKVCGRPQRREIAGLDLTVYPLFHPAAALRSTGCLNDLREHIGRIPELLAELQPPAAADAQADEPAPEPVGGATADQLGLFG
jgi:DNA polymerase